MCLPLAVFYYEIEGGNEKVVQLCWNACFFFIPFLLLCMLTFLLNIKKEYRHTFYSSESGKHVTLAYFQSSKDERRALVFRNNPRHWREIEGKVSKWVRESWERWMEIEPDWLDDNMKARIPPHMIPNIQDRESMEEMQSERRRSSLLGRLSARRRSSFIGTEKVAPDAKYAISTYTTNK